MWQEDLHPRTGFTRLRSPRYHSSRRSDLLPDAPSPTASVASYTTSTRAAAHSPSPGLTGLGRANDPGRTPTFNLWFRRPVL